MAYFASLRLCGKLNFSPAKAQRREVLAAVDKFGLLAEKNGLNSVARFLNQKIEWGISTMIVTTGNEIEDAKIGEYLGVVRGIVVRATGIGAGFIGGLKSIAGGNIEEFTRVCEAARQEAFGRMVQHALEMGADAVIGMRYDATEFSQGATEVLAYGTAVKFAHKE